MRKIIMTICLAIVLIFSVMPLANAKVEQSTSGDSSNYDPNAPNNTEIPANPYETTAPPAPESLNVGKYLSAPGQKPPNAQGGAAGILVNVINALVLTIGSFSFVSIVIGGFILVVSSGNESLTTKGKDIIKFAIIGLVVALLAYFLVAFVQSILYEVGS